MKSFGATVRIHLSLERSRELQARPPTHRDGALRKDKK